MRFINFPSLQVSLCRFYCILFLTGGLSGCAGVAPWERGALAKAHMAMDPTPMQSVMRGHNYSSREAAVGGHASGGGGCGCY